MVCLAYASGPWKRPFTMSTGPHASYRRGALSGAVSALLLLACPWQSNAGMYLSGVFRAATEVRQLSTVCSLPGTSCLPAVITSNQLGPSRQRCAPYAYCRHACAIYNACFHRNRWLLAWGSSHSFDITLLCVTQAKHVGVGPQLNMKMCMSGCRPR